MFHVSTPVAEPTPGELRKVAGFGVTIMGPPMAESEMVCVLFGSVAETFTVSWVPAVMHVSFFSTMLGGWLLQGPTITCMSRITQPMLTHTPLILRHSSTANAML